jgi:hypothetical protein
MVPADLAERVDQLQAVNTIFNQRKFVNPVAAARTA